MPQVKTPGRSDGLDFEKLAAAHDTLLDFVASQCCEGHTGRKWFDLDDEEKGFWRNEASTQVGEWAAEVDYHANRQKRATKDDQSPTP